MASISSISSSLYCIWILVCIIILLIIIYNASGLNVETDLIHMMIMESHNVWLYNIPMFLIWYIHLTYICLYFRRFITQIHCIQIKTRYNFSRVVASYRGEVAIQTMLNCNDKCIRKYTPKVINTSKTNRCPRVEIIMNQFCEK